MKSSNEWPDEGHDQGWPHDDWNKDWVPPGFKEVPEPTPEPTHEESLLASVAKVKAAWGELKAMQHRMDTIRTAILSIIHDNESLKREKTILEEVITNELSCTEIKYERDGTITLTIDGKEYHNDD